MKIIATVINDLTYDQRMIRICSSLAKAGYEVELVGRVLPQSKAIIPQAFQQKRLKCWFNKGKFFYLEYNIRLFFYLLFQQQDLIYSVDLDTILPGFWVAKWKGKPQVYDAHEYFTEVPEVVHRPRVKRIWEWVAQHTIPRIQYCYTVCESLANLFEQQYGTPFEVIRNVNYKSNWKSKSISSNDLSFSSDRIFLYQGALNEGRGLEAMIMAMQYVEGVQFYLAGEGDLSQELRALAQELGLGEKVKFLGYVLPKDLPALSQTAYAGINLLENKGRSYYYSLANKTFDYIQADLPAIHIGFPEYQKVNAMYEVAILVPDLQIETLVESIQKLLNDKAFYNRLQANCRLAAEVFHWEHEEQKLLAFFKKIE